MRISKLDHLVLVTGDLSRCVSFYRDLLHMEVEEKRRPVCSSVRHIKNQYHTCPEEIPAGGEKACAGSLDICFVTEEPLERLLDELKKRRRW